MDYDGCEVESCVNPLQEKVNPLSLLKNILLRADSVNPLQEKVNFECGEYRTGAIQCQSLIGKGKLYSALKTTKADYCICVNPLQEKVNMEQVAEELDIALVSCQFLIGKGKRGRTGLSLQLLQSVNPLQEKVNSCKRVSF